MHRSAALEPGTRLEGYRLKRLLGQGAMGAVYEAVQENIGRRVAIKVLHASVAEDQGLVARFLNEARAASRVAHPGLITVSELGQLPDGSHYIVMEFLEGETLADRLERQGRLPMGQALRLARQIALALAAVHARGIYHRDIKPSNIMVVADPDVEGGERAKVVDFGIAKVVAAVEEGAGVQTATGSVLGTPLYMSPEQCKAEPVSDRSDVYSLGIMLFEMVCGRTPFPRQRAAVLLLQHISAPPPTLASLRPEVAPDLSQLVGRMLAKAPAERPSMSEIAATLSRLCGLAPPAPTRGGWRFPAALGGALGLGLLVGGWRFWVPGAGNGDPAVRRGGASEPAGAAASQRGAAAPDLAAAPASQQGAAAPDLAPPQRGPAPEPGARGRDEASAPPSRPRGPSSRPRPAGPRGAPGGSARPRDPAPPSQGEAAPPRPPPVSAPRPRHDGTEIFREYPERP